MGLRVVVTRFKDYFTNLINRAQDTNRDQNSQGDNVFARAPNTLFGSILPQKRPASNAFELEITDDEDEELTSGGGYPYNLPIAKRPRGDYASADMSSGKRKIYPTSSSSQYVTRGSGRTPVLEGLKIQPWEFNFDNDKRSRINKKVNAEEVAPEPGYSGSATAGSSSIGVNSHLSSSYQANANSSSAAAAAKVVHIPIVRTGDESHKPKKSDPEVITLDDDDDDPYYNSLALVPAPVSSREMSLVPSKNSSHRRASKGRDQNRIFKSLNAVSKRFTGISASSSNNSFRPSEKNKYKELLERYNVINSRGTYSGNIPLFRSKVDQCDPKVLYARPFQSSPTNGTVSILSSTGFLESTAVPRLFSISNEPRSTVVNTGGRAPVPSVSTSPKDAPLVIDLEPDENCREIVPFEPHVSPISKSEKSSFAASLSNNIPVTGNYSNLEDALNNSALVGSELKEDFEQMGSTLSTPDEDISIISARIVNKSRDSSINTLALEQTSCPYIEKRWLAELKSTRKENQKHRVQRIREEEATMQLLRRESTLDKDLNEHLRKKLSLTEIIVLEEPPATLPELDDEMIRIIQHAKARGNDNEVLAQVRLPKDTISITRGDVKTLGPCQWLNDNVINTYMELIVLRSKLENSKFPKVYAFQTFFYPKLLKEGYSNSLKRWTRKDDLFAHDLIILPIHLGLHWCLACIDFRSKSIRYFDSLGGENNKCLHSLLDYISKEMRERKQMDLNKSEWSLQNVKKIPHQQNGSDCGMFECKFAEYLSRDAEISFTQENMPYYRDRM